MRSPLAGLSLLALVALAPTASAADPRAAARELANKGFEQYRAGRFIDAIESFRRADQLFHAPTLVVARAKAHTAAGQLVEARDLYLGVIAEKIPESASNEFRGAQNAARAEVATLDAKIPTLRLLIKPPGTSVRVTIDGAPVAAADLGRPIEKNPGTHVIIAIPAGGVGISRTVVLRDAARAVVDIDLPAVGALPDVPRPVSLQAPKRAPALPQIAPRPPEPARRGSLVPAFVSFGVGAVGLGLGIAMGVDTFARKSAIEGSPSCKRASGGFDCGSDQQAKLDSARQAATISTVGFVIGGVGAAAGVALVILRPGGKSAPGKVGLEVGPGSLDVTGVF